MSGLDAKLKKRLRWPGQAVAIVFLLAALMFPPPVSAASSCLNGDKPPQKVTGPCCGSGDSVTKTSIEIGCKGQGNSITDATFAIIRFLTNGVGVVLVASMVYAGIQYSASKGDPNGTNQAINRIRANVFALLLFVFAYALLNYIIPGSVLHS